MCEMDLWEETSGCLQVMLRRAARHNGSTQLQVLVGTASAVASSGKGNRTRHLQVTPTKATATKPRAHAVSHVQTISGESVARAIFGLARHVIQKNPKITKKYFEKFEAKNGVKIEFAVWGEEMLRSTLPSTLPSYFLDFPVSLFCSRPPGSQD